MHSISKYKQAASYSWTRIDMLLTIYDKVVMELQTGLKQIESGQLENLPLTRVSISRAILMIIDGLDLEAGVVPVQVKRICLFALEQTSGNCATSWRSALSVIQTIREGFVEIQEEARTAEYNGTIPALDVVCQ